VFQRDPEEPGRGFEDLKTQRHKGHKVEGSLDHSSVSSVPLCFKEILRNLEGASKIKKHRDTKGTK
jgi:hypothetical protein